MFAALERLPHARKSVQRLLPLLIFGRTHRGRRTVILPPGTLLAPKILGKLGGGGWYQQSYIYTCLGHFNYVFFIIFRYINVDH